MGGTAGSREEAENGRECFAPCKSLGEQARRKESEEARTPDSGARAHTTLEQAWTWESSSSQLGTKEQSCSFWLAVTNDCSSSHHLVIDDCERASPQEQLLFEWLGDAESWAKKSPSGNGVRSLFGISKYVSYFRYVCSSSPLLAST